MNLTMTMERILSVFKMSRGVDAGASRYCVGSLLLAIAMSGCTRDSSNTDGWRVEEDPARDSGRAPDAQAGVDAESRGDTSDVGSRELGNPFGEDVKVTSIAAGRITCAAYSNGRVRCAGHNRWAGIVESIGRGYGVSIPIVLPAVTGAVGEIGSSGSHVCVGVAPNGVQCWGDNSSFALTDELPEDRGVYPAIIPGVSLPSQIDVGDGFTCLLRAWGGTVECWGDDSRGQTGTGYEGREEGETVVRQPTQLSGLSDAVELIVGHSTACARLRDERIYCWGEDADGQIRSQAEHSGSRFYAAPVLMQGGEDIAHLCIGEKHACASPRRGGEVECWGNNIDGAVGEVGSGEDSYSSELHEDITAVDLACGADFTCALTEEGRVLCWGNNDRGQLGRGEEGWRISRDGRPEPVVEIENAVEIDAAASHICALLDGGSVKCWGDNTYGQLGDSSSIDKETPVGGYW